MLKKGDTLIEVVLAIGIFSMVAISVVAVISGSSAGSQTALETTLARQEIDAQAEALRFIQASTVADRNSADNRFAKIWNTIAANAVDLSGKTDVEQDAILQYAPTTCDQAYAEKNGVNPFIINTRALEGYINGANNNLEDILSYTKLDKTTTYPRITYGDDGDADYQAEGIYIIAVKDPNTTQIVSGENDGIYGHAAAYYDFYIRTCWYGIDANQASTISTVVRLHNPNLTEENVSDGSDGSGGGSGSGGSGSGGASIGGDGTITYYGNKGTIEGVSLYRDKKCPLDTCAVTSKIPTKKGNAPFAGAERRPSNFLGWSTNEFATFADEDTFLHKGDIFKPREIGTELYAIWEDWPMVMFDADGGSFSIDDNIGKIAIFCEPRKKCEIPNDVITKINNVTRSGYKFTGWAPSTPTKNVDFTSRKEDIIYKANWEEQNEEIKVTLSWNGPDYDAHYVGYDSGGKKFTAYYNNKTVFDTVTGRQIAHLNTDCRSGDCTEISTVYTLGGKDYTYFVYNFSNSSTISGATVTVKGQYTCPTTCTYRSSDATGSGRYWNVFSLINGRLVTNQKHSTVATDV